MNPYSPVNLEPGNYNENYNWMFPAFIATIIFLSIWWAG